MPAVGLESEPEPLEPLEPELEPEAGQRREPELEPELESGQAGAWSATSGS